MDTEKLKRECENLVKETGVLSALNYIQRCKITEENGKILQKIKRILEQYKQKQQELQKLQFVLYKKESKKVDKILNELSHLEEHVMNDVRKLYK